MASFSPCGRTCASHYCFTFFFTDTAPPEIYTLSLHDALPITTVLVGTYVSGPIQAVDVRFNSPVRSEEHTSELQSHSDLVCRLLLEKKKAGIAGSARARVQAKYRHLRSVARQLVFV